MYYLYILQSTKDPNWFYKGSTNDIHRRLCQHNAGLVRSTAPYKPLNLVYTEGYIHEFAARMREASIKKSFFIIPSLKINCMLSLYRP